MKGLEDDVASILTPMMERRQLMLSPRDRQLLCCWATKTALNFAFWSREAYTLPIPENLAHDLYAGRLERTPVPYVQVWVASYMPLGQFAYRLMTAQGYGHHPETGQLHSVLRVVFVAGHAVFYVRLPDSPEAQLLGWRDPLPQFTPLHEAGDGAISWLKDPLDDAGISEVFNRHIHAGIYPGQEHDVWRGLDEE
jgi:hypothetical protein